MEPFDSGFTALGVPPALVHALESRGITVPTSVQSALLDPAVGRRDIMVSAQTGSGKTVAFGLLVAPDLEARGRSAVAPKIVVVTPTRELAAQVRDELAWLFAPSRARVVGVTGGTSVVGDLRALGAGSDIVVGTPGRLLDHLRRGALVSSEISTVVLDEADEMLDMGFREELEGILQAMPSERRTVMLSATLPPEIVALARNYLRDPMRIAADPPGAANVDISHVAHLVPPSQRLDAIVNLLLAAPTEQAIVFVRTRADAADMGSELGRLGFAAAPLTGEMAQRERTHTLDAFRAGKTRTLVATDVAARGLDVPEVSRVIHADLPGDASTLTHRAGRTGRAGRKGTSVLLVPPFARGRANQLLRAAGATASWGPVPDVDQIRTGAEARLREKLLGEPPTRDERRTRLARELLAATDPVDLVARLLDEVRWDGPCAPRTIASPKRELRDVSAPRGTTSSHVIFRVNFGERDGATPSRLLAMLCRRGKVQGNDVGSIRIGAAGSTFGIAPGVAEQFGSASSHVDAREPHIRIERLGDEAVRGPRDRRDPVADSRRAPHRDQPRPARAKTKHRDPARP